MDPATLKNDYLSHLGYPTAAEVNHLRTAFSLNVLQAMIDGDPTSEMIELIDPHRTGDADPVGLVINRICGGLEYKIETFGSWKVDEDTMGYIHDATFGFFSTPKGKPALSMGCNECVFGLKDYAISEDVVANTASFAWTENQEDPVNSNNGYSNSGTLTIDSCRIDERNQLTDAPFLVSVQAHFDGGMTAGTIAHQGHYPFEGKWNFVFECGALFSPDMIDELETICKNGRKYTPP
jgi:hypothetical protein